MNTETKLDHFYEIHVQRTVDDYTIYWRSPILIPPGEVAMAAMMDGHLVSTDLKSVDYVLEITSEEYFEYIENS